MNKFNLSDRVKYSYHAIRPLEDLNANNNNRYRRELDQKRSIRGTVVSVETNGVKIAWDNNTQSSTMDYLIERA